MVIKSTGKGFVGFLLLSPALFILTSFNSGRAADYSSLQGYWQCEEEGVRSTLEFKSHSELIFNGQAANYQLKQNILRVQEEYGVTDYYLQFIGVILTIFSPDGSVTYCQKGEKPSKARKHRPVWRTGLRHTSGPSRWMSTTLHCRHFSINLPDAGIMSPPTP